MSENIYIKKNDGTLEEYKRDKVESSLQIVGATDEVIKEILDNIEKEFKGTITSTNIYELAVRKLHEKEKFVAVKYSLRKAISELGPNGYPFEKFVAEILKTKGYETLTDQVVYGGCVPHEMDVVAYKDDELIMVEAKFHNEFGLKSDVKVALYIKARFDDLKEAEFLFGGRKRKLKEGWLVTNTKFTEQAIHYAECKGLKLIGWNYPKHENLQNLIETAGLHPFTCLTSLSGTDKRRLLEQGILLCKDIKNKPVVLNFLGIDDEKKKAILNEINQICGY